MNQGTKRQPIFKAEEIFKSDMQGVCNMIMLEKSAMHALLFFNFKQQRVQALRHTVDSYVCAKFNP